MLQLVERVAALVLEGAGPPLQLAAGARFGRADELARRRRHALQEPGTTPTGCAGVFRRCSRSRASLANDVGRHRRRSRAGAVPACRPAVPRASSNTTSSVSPSPAKTAGRKIRSPAIPFRPAASVSRWPARLPLSTVETYSGRSGSSVRVSYQL